MTNPGCARSPTGSRSIVAEMLERRVKDPRLGFVTITDVRVTGDTQQASVFYTVLGEDERAGRVGGGAGVGQGPDPFRGRQAARHAARADAGVHPRRAARDRRHIDELLAKARESDAAVAAAAAGAPYAGEADPYRKPHERRARRATSRRRPTRPTADDADE